MTELFCKTNHLWGRDVQVNGVTYAIDAEGIVKIDNDVAVKKLLTMDSWTLPGDPSTGRGHRQRVPKSKRGAYLSDGTFVPTQSPEDDGAGEGSGDDDFEKSSPEGAEDGAGAGESSTPERAGEDGEFDVKANDALAGRNPETGEYPDPKSSMRKDQLQALARVYQVPFEEETTKAQLIELTMAAMYT